MPTPTTPSSCWLLPTSEYSWSNSTLEVSWCYSGDGDCPEYFHLESEIEEQSCLGKREVSPPESFIGFEENGVPQRHFIDLEDLCSEFEFEPATAPQKRLSGELLKSQENLETAETKPNYSVRVNKFPKSKKKSKEVAKRLFKGTTLVPQSSSRAGPAKKASKKKDEGLDGQDVKKKGVSSSWVDPYKELMHEEVTSTNCENTNQKRKMSFSFDEDDLKSEDLTLNISEIPKENEPCPFEEPAFCLKSEKAPEEEENKAFKKPNVADGGESPLIENEEDERAEDASCSEESLYQPSKLSIQKPVKPTSRKVRKWNSQKKCRRITTATSKTGKSRGNYNMLTLDQRVQLLNFASKNGIDATHHKYRICKSRIRRYLSNGADRKKGGGRKTLDPDMEINLLNWIEKSTIDSMSFPSRCLIKEKARSLTRVDNFLASKGWCDKFFKRNAERLEEIRAGMSIEPSIQE